MYNQIKKNITKGVVNLKTDELLSVADRVNDCDVRGLLDEIIAWAEEEKDDEKVYNTLNTVAYTVLEHCSFD